MDWLTLTLFGAVFLFSVSFIGVVYLGWKESRFAEKRAIKRRLLYMSAGGSHGKERLALYKERRPEDAGLFGGFLLSLPRLGSLDRLLIRSKTSMTATAFFLVSAGLALAGLVLGMKFLPQRGAAILLAAGLALIPYLKLRSDASASLRRLEEQMPEALDLLTRAMRSGHALTSAMELVAQEMADPIGSEFSATVDQIKFGLSTEDALENLCERVPSADLRFFAITVLVHKETGGNIAEVFSKIGGLIRERLQFRNQVKAMTAEGRLSAWVLVLLPVFMFLFMYLRNFEYISLLWTEHAGRVLLGGALLMQLVGGLVMKHMVKLEV